MIKKLPQNIEKEIREERGNPLRTGTNGQVKGLNEQYFAKYIAKTTLILYSISSKSFMCYNSQNGIWEQISDNKVIDQIGKILIWYAREYDMSDVESYCSSSLFSSILKLLKCLAENKDAFVKRYGYYYHCKNYILEYDMKAMRWGQKDFSPDYYSLYSSPIEYTPNANCPRFISSLLKNAMTPDDIEHLQVYMGQCLLGINISQTFLLLIGTPGGGKSTLVNVIEKIIGRWNCAELRLQHMTGRFEISSTRGKSLLTGKDVDSEFMNGPGARALKVLTGNDTVSAEYKNSNIRHDIEGSFNVIITSNNLLRIKFDGDIDAWRRRMLVIKYDNPPPDEKIPNFDDILLEEEGSGILGWAMAGAVKLMKNKGVIRKSDEQKSRVDIILKSSQPFAVFGKLFIHPTPRAAITTEEAVTTFFRFCKKMGWPEVSERNAQKAFHAWMRTTYNAVLRTDIKVNGRNKRGYAGFQIKKK